MVQATFQKTLVVSALALGILVFGIATLRGMGRHTIVLTGIAFSYLFSALGALMQFIADERELASIVSWTFGDLGSANWKQIGILAIVVAVGTTMGVIQSGSYTLLSSGEEGVAVFEKLPQPDIVEVG